MVAAGRVLLLVMSVLLGGIPASPGHAQAPGQATPPAEIVVKDLAVQGNRRVQDALILGRIATRIGAPFVPTRLAEDIRNIFALGFFDDVQAKVEDFEGGVKITFVVAERPFIRDITFAGVKKQDTAKLQEKIDLKLGAVYNPVEVNIAADALRESYEDEGYFEARITPDVERLPDGDVSVIFRILEGRKITIDKIVIEGAQGLSPSAIKAVMATQERLYLILPGTVQRQRLDEDLDRITQFYNDNGYLQARVESHDIQVDRDKAEATIRIVMVEGPQFRTGAIDITGNNVLPLEDIRRQVLLTTGGVFSRAGLRDSVRRIVDLYGSIGRAAADVNPTLSQDAAERLVNIAFEINEGPETFVERINITGNTRSQENILRRELPFVEGDLFTTPKLARARQRLVNLGYFEQVRATTTPGASRDKVIVNIDVTERPTGVFSLGAGFSSADGFVGTLDLSQNNFLGRGWQLSLRLRAGADTQQGTIGFTEPWLFDTPISAGFDIFNNRRVFTDFTQYTQDSLGGDIRFSGPVGDFSRWNAVYRVSRDEISDIPPEAGADLLSQEGTTLTSAIGASLAMDTRDTALGTSRGGQASIGFDFAGVGFGVEWIRVLASASQYYALPWGFRWGQHIIAGRVLGGYSLGWGDAPVPLIERFFLGGSTSLRMYETRQVSPTDPQGNLIGGNIELLSNTEYVVPLPFGLRASLWFDMGNVYGPDIAGGTPFNPTKLLYGIGAGMAWASPFGPLRVDYGIKLNPRPGDALGAFNFSVGAPF
jgi:outer membrane protein insertion porin family